MKKTKRRFTLDLSMEDWKKLNVLLDKRKSNGEFVCMADIIREIIKNSVAHVEAR